MKRPQVCGASKLGKKKQTDQRFLSHRETNPTGNSAPYPPPRQSWIPRPRMEVEPPFASGGPGAFHPGLGELGGAPQLVRLYRNFQEKLGKFFGEFPPECETTKTTTHELRVNFLGGWRGEVGTKDLKVCLYFRVNSWTSWHKDSGDPKFSMEKSGAKNQISETQGPRKLERFNFDSYILFLSCFVRAFPTKPRFKTLPQVCSP